eukprot:CAMPEP_0175892940 /NCGR_PEP_ID=MMETSP0107_2-20121207/49190_1 /TAXON_ID=195067 ORGANISM="Goniomonas pacifica, Strain CCMP1869" /NCGR_SAMPLE_ID=MMETSP0107_2 /ASSEMBLY_ACC=CAM_ASM_000203 /LENGTH=58 /DNA_ID=CAMNT_0017213927 /DNA_START=329 /DNA_END=505 /DNA_ORIENTATION=+
MVAASLEVPEICDCMLEFSTLVYHDVVIPTQRQCLLLHVEMRHVELPCQARQLPLRVV